MPLAQGAQLIVQRFFFGEEHSYWVWLSLIVMLAGLAMVTPRKRHLFSTRLNGRCGSQAVLRRHRQERLVLGVDRT
jgi:drug/metabolite transporter (DMT)-like permease